MGWGRVGEYVRVGVYVLVLVRVLVACLPDLAPIPFPGPAPTGTSSTDAPAPIAGHWGVYAGLVIQYEDPRRVVVPIGPTGWLGLWSEPGRERRREVSRRMRAEGCHIVGYIVGGGVERGFWGTDRRAQAPARDGATAVWARGRGHRVRGRVGECHLCFTQSCALCSRLLVLSPSARSPQHTEVERRGAPG